MVLLSCLFLIFFFFFKQKTAYEMRISDWSSDVCSSDLQPARPSIRASRLLINIVADLKASNPAFNAKWLEFKAVYWLDEPEGDDANYDEIVKADRKSAV